MHGTGTLLSSRAEICALALLPVVLESGALSLRVPREGSRVASLYLIDCPATCTYLCGWEVARLRSYTRVQHMQRHVQRLYTVQATGPLQPRSISMSGGRGVGYRKVVRTSILHTVESSVIRQKSENHVHVTSVTVRGLGLRTLRRPRLTADPPHHTRDRCAHNTTYLRLQPQAGPASLTRGGVRRGR